MLGVDIENAVPAPSSWHSVSGVAVTTILGWGFIPTSIVSEFSLIQNVVPPGNSIYEVKEYTTVLTTSSLFVRLLSVNTIFVKSNTMTVSSSSKFFSRYSPSTFTGYVISTWYFLIAPSSKGPSSRVMLNSAISS